MCGAGHVGRDRETTRTQSSEGYRARCQAGYLLAYRPGCKGSRYFTKVQKPGKRLELGSGENPEEREHFTKCDPWHAGYDYGGQHEIFPRTGTIAHWQMNCGFQTVIPSESPDSRAVTLILCGDVMTGRGIDQILAQPSNPALHERYVCSALEYVEMAERANGRIPRAAAFSYIWGDAIGEFDRLAAAARIVNLETSITTCEGYDPKGISYRMHPANTACLTAAKIDCCVLANNHVMDWGRPGLGETLATLRAWGVKTAGATCNRAEASKPAVIETGSVGRVLVFAAGTEDSGIPPHWAATDTDCGVALLSDLSDCTVEHIAGLVRAVKQPGDIAILSIHWGENWGYTIPAQQRTFAHRVMDHAGIDVIHGHSSHHPKGIEVYRGKPVLYGCGDFLNDYEGISGYEEYRSHLVLMYCVKMDTVDGRLLALEMTPFEIKQFRLSYAPHECAQWLLDTLHREGKRLDTEVVLSAANRLILQL